MSFCSRCTSQIRQIPSQYMALAVAGFSILALGSALIAQYLYHLRPCELCLVQRYPFGITIFLGLLAFFWASKRIPLIALSGVVFIINSGIALFHSGVERKWWAGLTGCTSPDMSGSIEELMKRIQETAVTRCDEIAWSFMGLSMANYNVIFCFALFLVCSIYVYSAMNRKIDNNM